MNCFILRRLLPAIFTLLCASLGHAQNVMTISKEYSKEELQIIFSSSDFLAIQKKIEEKIDATPEKDKAFVTDTELVFTWGTDWPELFKDLEAHQSMKPMWAAMNSKQQFLKSRYVPKRRAEKLKNPPTLEPAWQKMEFNTIAESVVKAPRSRIGKLGSLLPGFTAWLFEGAYLTPWIITDKPFTEEFCKNQHVYTVEQKIVACQDKNFVKFQKSFIEETKDNLKVRSEVFLHELIRFRVMLLAQISSLSQAQQDSLTARLTFALLDESVSSESIFKMLLDAHLLIDNDSLVGLRFYEQLLALDKQMALLTEMIKFNSRCDGSSYNYDHVFYPAVDSGIDIVTQCRRYVKPDDDPAPCSSKVLAFHIWDYERRCKKPLPRK